MAGRTLSIDRALLDLLDQGDKCLVIELGCGLQERSRRITKQFPSVHYIDTDLEDVIAMKPEYTENITSQICDITKAEDLRNILNENVGLFDRIILVAEGVLVYFSPEQLAPLFTIMAEYHGKGSIALLFESYKIHRGMAYHIVKTYQTILGWLTQSKMDILNNHRRFVEDFFTVPGIKLHSTKRMIKQKRLELFVNTIGTN